MPKITLYFTDSEFASFITNNPQIFNAIRTRIKTPRSGQQKPPTKIEHAKRLLNVALANSHGHRVVASEMEDLILNAGISRATLHRARTELGLELIIRGFGGYKKSYWCKPLTE